MLKIACIGCGAISGVYLRNLARLPGVEVVACADLQHERARSRAAEFGVARVQSMAETLADPSIEAVLNLTVPSAHAGVAMAALRAGKHVYNEKPLAVDLEEGRGLVAEAEHRGLRLGCAPDTFLGAGLQTCRGLIDNGAIGRPLAATAFMLCPGHESWHPDPAFYYQRGGGPMFDMGPYYLTAMVFLLGPIRRVSGAAAVPFAQRTITSEPRRGATIDVDVPTHVASLLEFHGGAIATLVTSFDVRASRAPIMEVYGADGVLSLHDPNAYGGPVLLARSGGQAAAEWERMPLASTLCDNWRGVGLADMAGAIAERRPHRASGELALHVLEVMHAIHEAATHGRHIAISTRPPRPDPLDAAAADAWSGV